MKAIIKKGPFPGVSVEDIPIPECGDDDVLVEVKAAGICGSDVHIYEWTPNYEWTVPHMPYVLGHEFAGVVEQTGKNVVNCKPGDRVVCRPAYHCGQCHYCKTDRRHFCSNNGGIAGLTRNGGMAEFAVMKEAGIVHLPDNVTMEQAAIIEPMGVTANAVNDAGLHLGDFVVVQGPGPIGLLTMLFAKANGAGKCVMIGTSKDEGRLQVAREMGADYTFKSDEMDVMKAVMDLTDGFGADVVFEATGVPRLAQQALDMVEKSGKVVLVGIYPAAGEINLTTTVRQAKKLIGTYGGFISWERLLSWVSSNNPIAEKATKIISHTSSVDAANEAFERCVKKENIKEIFTSFK